MRHNLLGYAALAATVEVRTVGGNNLYAAAVAAGARRYVAQSGCYYYVPGDGLADESVATIAFRWGFGDLSGFNRAFRATFGATPREVRARPSEGALR